ncbi:MAG TPA: DNA-processing protein DprA [Acidimicrobiia bacterium]|nr:DNA-processing protein DprA [Acidimicrobiia bacterium]
MSPSPDELAAATLVCLAGMTPTRLRTIIDTFGSPGRALRGVVDGDADEVLGIDLRRWRTAADVDATATVLARRGTTVHVDGTETYPIADAIPDRPAVLLAEGARGDAFHAPRVAIVGTRAATPHGLADAEELGGVLGAAGITVVSGLAIGIDAAAHRGAIDAGGRVVGVVATGLDITYPRRHARLFDEVRAHGVLVGEQGFGVQPLPARFPVRNRIIAGLADIVVVVEATRRGGARITAHHALEYGRPVLAVPGSRRNVAAEGTNELIADGAQPLLEWTDVLLALGLDAAASNRTVPQDDPRPPVGTHGAVVLRALGGESATLDQLTSRTSLAPSEVAVAVRALERDRWVERAQGAVWPR